LREAVTVDDQVDARAWAAWSRYELARILCADEQEGQALAEGKFLLREASETAERLGLRWLATAIKTDRVSGVLQGN
jgi:hypothetical protein